MAISDLSTMLKDSLEGIKDVLEKESLSPKPIILEDGGIILPINKLSIGFLTAGGEVGQKVKFKNDDLPLGAVGGGLTVTPVGFFIYKDGISNLLNIQGDGTDKWLELIYTVIRKNT